MASLLLDSESESVLFPVDAAVDGVADKEGVDDAAEADVGTAWRIALLWRNHTCRDRQWLSVMKYPGKNSPSTLTSGQTETDTHRDLDTDTATAAQTHTDANTDIEADTDMHTDKDTDTDTDSKTDQDIDMDIDIDTQAHLSSTDAHDCVDAPDKS